MSQVGLVLTNFKWFHSNCCHSQLFNTSASKESAVRLDFAVRPPFGSKARLHRRLRPRHGSHRGHVAAHAAATAAVASQKLAKTKDLKKWVVFGMPVFGKHTPKPRNMLGAVSVEMVRK